MRGEERELVQRSRRQEGTPGGGSVRDEHGPAYWLAGEDAEEIRRAEALHVEPHRLLQGRWAEPDSSPQGVLDGGARRQMPAGEIGWHGLVGLVEGEVHLEAHAGRNAARCSAALDDSRAAWHEPEDPGDETGPFVERSERIEQASKPIAIVWGWRVAGLDCADDVELHGFASSPSAPLARSA